MKIVLYIVTIATFALCMGCATLRNPGAPDQSFNEDNDIKALEKRYGEASSITRYYDATQLGICSNSPSTHCSTISDCPIVTCNAGSCSNSPSTHCSTVSDCPIVTCNPSDTKAARNEFITGRLTLINLQYIKFIRQFAVSKSQMESAFDVLITGVGLATAVTGGEAAKAALGAASAGLGATRTSIDKNFFYEKTVPVLITAMNAQRKVVLLPILDGIKQDINTYPLAQALTDLSEYYFAGTFIGALQAVQKDAGAKEEAADKKIEIARLPEAAILLASQPVRDKCRALLKKVDALSNDQAIALAKNPPVADGALAPVLLKRFPTKVWETDPAAARDVLKFRITMMVSPVIDLPAWDNALP
jgi:hypothetical protein